MTKKKEVKQINYKSILIIFCIFVLVFFFWRFFLAYTKCEDWDCFNQNLKECNRAKFIGGSDMIFEYNILKKSDEKCVVEIILLQGELNNQDSKKLEGKSMECYLPLGIIMLPESNLGYCNGILKESFQELFITKLYIYIIQNIGRINLEVLDPRKIINQSL
jgi:hypothetical protein